MIILINRKSTYTSLEYSKLVKAREGTPGDDEFIMDWERIVPKCGIDWETDTYQTELKIKDVHIESAHDKQHLNTATIKTGVRRIIGYYGRAGDLYIDSESDDDDDDDDDDEMKGNDENKNKNRNRNRNRNANKRSNQRSSNRKKGKSARYHSYTLPNFKGAKTNQITLIRRSVYGTDQKQNPYFKLFDTNCRIILIIVHKTHSNNLYCYEGLINGETYKCNVRSIGWVRVAVGEETHFNIVYAPNTWCKAHKIMCKIFHYLSNKDKLYLGYGDKVVYKKDKTFETDNSHHFKYKWYTLVAFKDCYDINDTSHYALSKRYHVSSTVLRVS